MDPVGDPSLGTVPIEIVREACNSARQNPAEENTFPQLRLNQWVKWQHPRGELSL